MRPKTFSFELPVEGTVYTVKATPYTIATKENRFRVSINESPVYIFGWNNDFDRFAVIDDNPSIIRGNLEMAIAQKLQYAVPQKYAA
jgi:uncharacterized protein with WD repeat